MFDIKKVEEEARKEINEEKATEAKRKLKAKLKQIEDSRKITANLEMEYQVILRDIGG